MGFCYGPHWVLSFRLTRHIDSGSHALKAEERLADEKSAMKKLEQASGNCRLPQVMARPSYSCSVFMTSGSSIPEIAAVSYTSIIISIVVRHNCFYELGVLFLEVLIATRAMQFGAHIGATDFWKTPL